MMNTSSEKGTGEHTFGPSTLEAEAGKYLWGQPGLCRETLSPKTTTYLEFGFLKSMFHLLINSYMLKF